MKEEKREIQAPPNKQLIMDIGKTKLSKKFCLCP